MKTRPILIGLSIFGSLNLHAAPIAVYLEQTNSLTYDHNAPDPATGMKPTANSNRNKENFYVIRNLETHQQLKIPFWVNGKEKTYRAPVPWLGGDGMVNWSDMENFNEVVLPLLQKPNAYQYETWGGNSAVRGDGSSPGSFLPVQDLSWVYWYTEVGGVVGVRKAVKLPLAKLSITTAPSLDGTSSLRRVGTQVATHNGYFSNRFVEISYRLQVSLTDRANAAGQAIYGGVTHEAGTCGKAAAEVVRALDAAGYQALSFEALGFLEF